ncbi:hypothetical protein [Amycolatopsis sp. CA-126428]|uniref:hypothetical protein n=1 Tax=Amycolatopsis sp. CA-126428 TaxID=2073158 RepID=UPI001304EE88|nr:hypothetical protein [Amycolatopsis sp. CA-126428]
MTGGGFRVSSEPLANFGKHLDELQKNLQGTADLVGGMTCDPACSASTRRAS